MSTNIFAPPLTVGCTVGLVSPCETKSRERLEITATALRSLGFNVRFGTNTFKDTWGYAASASERAEDINRMAADDDVRLVILGGGETATEVLPLLDYELIASKPKRYCSFSDGTSILNAITSQCHLVTYHGQSFRTFDDLSEYNLTNFLTRVMRDDGVYRPANDWTILRGGTAEGTAVCGYTQNLCLLLSSPFFKYDISDGCVVFTEDHSFFSCEAAVARYISHLAQSDFFKCVKGVVFGCYDESDSEEGIIRILGRMADALGIPVAKCRDFGHGENNAVIPNGARCRVSFEPQPQVTTLL